VTIPSHSPEAGRTIDAWRRHNRRLLAGSIVSMLAAAGLWFAAASPDGRDRFYLAVAIEFFVWGAIDALFAILGMREIRRLDATASDEAILTKGESLRRLLRINHGLNVLWLSIGAALIVWGYRAWSASLVGHGFGVFSQAILLGVLDLAFANALRQPGDSDGDRYHESMST
jgi:hypothetical protein